MEHFLVQDASKHALNKASSINKICIKKINAAHFIGNKGATKPLESNVHYFTTSSHDADFAFCFQYRHMQH